MTTAAFKATYSDWKLVRSRKVIQVVLEIPLEAAGQAYDVLGGMPNPAAETWCAVARLNSESEVMPSARNRNIISTTETAPASEADNAPVRAHHSFGPDKRRLLMSAVMSCKDPIFWAFLAEHGMLLERNEASAKTAVHLICHVKSRSEIIPGTPAAEEWNILYSKYIAWKLVAA